MADRVDRMFNAAIARAINAEELVAKLRECKGGKLSFTDTPNWLRIQAADRIEQLSSRVADLERELVGIRAGLDPQPSDEWPTYMAVRAMSVAHAAEKALADRLYGAISTIALFNDPDLDADYRKARGL